MATSWETYLSDHRDENYNDLLELLRIPSISTDPAHNADVAAAADWVAARLKKAGVPEVEVVSTAKHPVVIGRWHAAPGKQTVIVYGHYDVQPVDPLDLWETPPFEPTEKNGLLFARGAADMKANLVTLVQAVEALANENGAPPVNLTFLFEGEEEIGSPNLPALVAEEKEKLAADLALSADGGMGGENLPIQTVSSKGLAGVQINVQTSTTDLHSGSYGAAVPNAVQALVQLAATFHTPDGKVAVEGFYDDVRELSKEERAKIASYPESDDELIAEAGVQGLWGEPGYTSLERRWVRPTVDFNGIWGGFQGEGTKTVTPAQAHLKVTCRLVANQNPDKIQDLLVKHVEKHTPPHVKVNVERFASKAFPYEIRADHPALAKEAKVLKEIYGVEPRIARTGGTVPINEVFQRELGVDVVTIGFGLPGSKVHAPNEQYHLSQFDLAQRVYGAYLKALGED
jgi:acetylornithine deacetylase/succinyl-diaminopimelate desuccinylase-like protein